MRPILYILASALVLGSCKTGILGGKRSPHEQYEKKLKDAGLLNSSPAVQWITASKQALEQPVLIDLPFEEKGYFAAEHPSAIAYRFTGKRGMKIVIMKQSRTDSGAVVFMDVWKYHGNKENRVASSSQRSDTVEVVMEADDEILIRIQPELLTSAEYELKINFGPSLAFPVDSSGEPVFISYWAAPRDAGKRKHEGVDIRAKKYTPALAAASGYARIADNRLGGKAVFIYNREMAASLYYAHLDSQLVRTGDRVQQGDTVGLIGNTGNARGTVPHLHFGIYTDSGAINPLHFIQPNTSKPKPVTASGSGIFPASINATIVISGDNRSVKITKGTPIIITGANGSSYRARLPQGQYLLVTEKKVHQGAIAHQKLEQPAVLLEKPDISAVGKMEVDAGTDIPVFGSFNGYVFTIVDGIRGWLRLQD